jgi:hypothetical protein
LIEVNNSFAETVYNCSAEENCRKTVGSEKLEEKPPPVSPEIEVLRHEWHPDVVWEKIGKTKFVWKATVRNNSNIRKRVFVYYDLLDVQNVPLARNVTNQFIEPHQTVEVISDSYIISTDLPGVKSSRATVKIWPGR